MNVSKLNEIMRKNRLTQKAFAQSIGLSQSAVSAVLKGRREVSIRKLKAICEKYDVKAEEIW